MSINSSETLHSLDHSSEARHWYSFAHRVIEKLAADKTAQTEQLQVDETHDSENFTLQEVTLERPFHPDAPPARLRLAGIHYNLNRKRGSEGMRSFVYYPDAGQALHLNVRTEGKKPTTIANLYFPKK